MVAAFLHNVKILLNVRSNLARRFFFCFARRFFKSSPCGRKKGPLLFSGKEKFHRRKKDVSLSGKKRKEKKISALLLRRSKWRTAVAFFIPKGFAL